MAKHIKKVKEFKEGRYYSFIKFSLQAIPSNPIHFLIMKITKDGTVTIKGGDGRTEESSLYQLEKALDFLQSFCKYSTSDKEIFIAELQETISKKNEEITKLSNEITDIEAFILDLP